jgi:hypothetical protein
MSLLGIAALAGELIVRLVLSRRRADRMGGGGV